MTDAQTQSVDIFFQLYKVDQAKREVWGRATEEKPDLAREIMDYDSSKPNFKKWSDMAKARTTGVDGLPDTAMSLGNVRKMHEPIAAGKVINIDFNDSEKAIDIGTYCSDDATWNQILDGTLTGFSIGGSAKRWIDPRTPSLRRYTAEPVEVSYVDAPCLPSATYKLIKADGSEELRKVMPSSPALENITSDEHEGVPAVASVEKVESGAEVKEVSQVAGGFVSPDLIDQRAVAPIDAPRTEPVAKAEQPEWVATFTSAVKELAALNKAHGEEIAKSESLLKAVGERVGIARRDGSPLAAAPGYPANDSDYGDPANWSWPLDTSARIYSAIAKFKAGHERGRYSQAEWHVLGRRIASRATTTIGLQYQYNPLHKDIRIEGTMSDLTKDAMSGLISQLQAGIKAGVDMIGKDPAAAQAMFMQVIGDLEGSKPDSSATTSTSNPTAPIGTDQPGSSNATLKAMTTDTSSMMAAATPVTSSPSTMTMAATTPSSSDSSTSTSTGVGTTTAYQDMMGKQLEALTATVAKLAEQISAKPAAPVEKGVTVGDLAALMASQVPTEDPVLKALTSGDPYALQKAARVAGSENAPDVHAVYQKIDQAVNDSLRPLFTRQMIAKGYNHFNGQF